MSVLIISPDYASHLLPLATLAGAWQDAGEDVVVATGPATASIVDTFGFRRVDLRLGRGSNPGVIRVDDQPAGEDTSLQGFFDATRSGMVSTLTYQAEQRTTDLLWEPVANAERVLDLVHRLRPTAIIVDHLAFSARIALDVAGIPYADVVLGHPSALPVAGEMYGYPTTWPAAFDPDPAGLRHLGALCERVARRFTEQWNAAAATLDPGRTAVDDAFAVAGDLLLLNYPAQLHPTGRTAALPRHAFLGSALRSEVVDADIAQWLAAQGDPIVFVSFGSFLSARADVLAVVAAGLRGAGVRVAMATGSADVRLLGDIPEGWLVRAFLPQVAIVGKAAVLITHGGNNSVTEASALGVPMVLLPFSTDQFAGAAAVEEYGTGLALDPQNARPEDIRSAVERLLDSPAADRARDLGTALMSRPGAVIARDHLQG